MLLIVWALGVFLLPFVSADSCCGDSSCTESCPWNAACNDGQDYSCMDSIAGIFKCRDMSACTSYDDCGEQSAAYRSGQLCHHFPWYNGGYPLDKISFDSEKKWFDCQEPSNNSEYCDSWSVLEDSADEFEIGNVDCTLPSPNNKYCESWFTEKKEYKKCWLELVQNSDNSGYTYVTACCGDDGYKNEPCCKTICPVSYYNAYQPQVEDIRCNCTTESENKEYCADWYCELVTLYDPYGNDKPVQHEWYTCTSSEDGKYCSAWTGKIESIEEFELAACSCQVAGTDSSYCDKWTCYEKGTDYWWPNLLWILFPILLGSLTFMMPLIGGWGVFVHAGFWLCHVVWSGSLIVIGIWKAGLVVMFISILPLYVIPSLWILVYNVRVYNWNTILDSSLNNRTGMTASRRVTTNRGGVLGRRDVPDGLQAAVTVGDVELAAGILVEVTLEDLKGYVDVVAYERLHSTILDSDDID